MSTSITSYLVNKYIESDIIQNLSKDLSWWDYIIQFFSDHPLIAVITGIVISGALCASGYYFYNY